MAKKRHKQENKTEKEQRLKEYQDKTKWFWWEGDVLVFNILGKPSAKITKIGKPFGNQLKISVACAPVNGRATDFLVKFLAHEFDVKVRDIEVVFGRMNVNKQLRVTKPNKLPSVFKGTSNNTFIKTRKLDEATEGGSIAPTHSYSLHSKETQA